ncbi:MAG: thermonuclease family protein [Candidatus Bipolaricaulia bacterium]
MRNHRFIRSPSLLIGVALVLALVLSIPSVTAVAIRMIRADMVRVVDGDTIVVRLTDGSEETVRLIGVDTPEMVHPNRPVEPWVPEASAFTKALLQPGQLLERESVQFQEMTQPHYNTHTLLSLMGRVMRYVCKQD